MIFWKKNKKQQSEEQYYTANQWQLIWRKFRKHRLANIGATIIFLFYFITLFCEFLAPYNPHQRHANYIYMPPKWPQLADSRGNWHLIPFTPAAEAEFNYDTFSLKYNYDDSKRYKLRVFVKGEPYKFWGLFEWDRHLIGVEDGGVFFPFGTDRFGRCIYSRLLYGTRISMTIGLVGVILSLTLGMLLGGISGYYGGWIDIVVQRIIELLRAFPSIPLWMALAAIVPPTWAPFRIFIVMSCIF